MTPGNDVDYRRTQELAEKSELNLGVYQITPVTSEQYAQVQARLENSPHLKYVRNDSTSK